MSDRPRLEPEDVVQASMRGLELGELVCAPRLEDDSLLDRRDEAELAVLAAGTGPELAARYVRPSSRNV